MITAGYTGAVEDGGTDDGIARAGAAVAARRRELGISQRELARQKVITAPALIHYVTPTGGNVAPYTNWETAAHSIQIAIISCASVQGERQLFDVDRFADIVIHACCQAPLAVSGHSIGSQSNDGRAAAQRAFFL